jgi:Na+-transporting NADH:ubiquinone oxidoreductase subunit NqrC
MRGAGMKKIKAKLADSRGESLPEMLASILIGSLSVSLLVGGVMVSSNINQKAASADDKFYEALSIAEEKKTDVSDADSVVEKKLVISENDQQKATIEINVYGGDTLYSYRKKDLKKEGTPDS